MRCVFIRPLNDSHYYDPEIQEPLGLEYLSAILQNRGHKVMILDSALDNIDDIKAARRAISFEPDIIGFSITTSREINSVLAIYNECNKQSNKEIVWLAGGNFVTSEINNACSLLPEKIFMVRYEGEITITELANQWETTRSISFPNRIIEGKLIKNLDDLIFPVRPYYKYLLNFGWAFNIQGSRGCCSSCKYCASFGMRNKTDKSWRGRTPHNIVSEIESLYKTFNARTFNFVDEDFLGPPINALTRAKNFSEEILKNGLDITFGIQVRPNALSEEIIDYLVNAGLKYVFMGIESDNADDLKRWGRIYCENTWNWVELLQKNDVEVNAGTLLFHPDCTFESIRSFATKLKDYHLFNYRTAINRLDAMPGSYFHEQYTFAHQLENKTGILPLPFINPEIETFFIDINKALSPIEAPSLHAICSLPPIQTYRKKSKMAELKYHQLKNIINTCDNQVCNCFFSILQLYENKANSENLVEMFRKENLETGKTVFKSLVENDFVRSPEILYRAINNE